jgi:hypothetical protein
MTAGEADWLAREKNLCETMNQILMNVFRKKKLKE